MNKIITTSLIGFVRSTGTRRDPVPFPYESSGLVSVVIVGIVDANFFAGNKYVTMGISTLSCDS